MWVYFFIENNLFIIKANLLNIHDLYPFTRDIKRKFIYHHGPTNSGKTYNVNLLFLLLKNF